MPLNNMPSIKQPIAFVVFGATGDLTQDKIYPALYHLAKDGLLSSSFRLIGVANQSLTTAQFTQHVKLAMKAGVVGFDDAVFAKFAKTIDYLSLDLAKMESYNVLEQKLGALEAGAGELFDRVFYLALPPVLFKQVLGNLNQCDLSQRVCRNQLKRTKVIIEKPFGNDYKTAQNLEMLVTTLFNEQQIFRIDHFLGKESVQNIVPLRFANPLFSQIWNSTHVERIEIIADESVTVRGRGGYYDSAGAIRDMVQNHLLQLLALVTMDAPTKLDAQAIRRAKEAVLAVTRPFKKRVRMVRGQYQGYLHEPGVARGSRTETFFAGLFEVANRRWSGVPILIKTGKGLASKSTQVHLYLKAAAKPFGAASNRLTLNIAHPAITVSLNSMNAGLADLHAKDLTVTCEEHICPTPTGDYERLLEDIFAGNQTLFTSGEEILLAWKAVAPFLAAAQRDRLRKYALKSAGPELTDLTL